jgi:hypothetical protein
MEDLSDEVRGANDNAPPLDDPRSSGFTNSYFTRLQPTSLLAKAKPKVDLQSLPELVLFSDWEPTLLLMPSVLTTSKTTHMIYSRQHEKLLNRYTQYCSSLRQQIVIIKSNFQCSMVNGSFNELLENPKNDEERAKTAEKFFVSLYKAIEKNKVVLKDEVLGYLLGMRLNLLKRNEPTEFLRIEYDFSKLSEMSYLRSLALHNRIVQCLMDHMEYTALKFVGLSPTLYRARLERELQVVWYRH